MSKQKLEPEYIFVERPILQQLKEHGWDILELEMFGQSPVQSKRKSFEEIIIKSDLVSAIKEINKVNGTCFVSDEQIEGLVSSLVNPVRKSLLAVNEEITKHFIQSYPTIGKSELNNEEGRPVKLIDFENPERNRFLAITQFQIKSLNGNVFPDITLFVNGIPLCVIECKHAKGVDSDPIYTGIEDLRMYQGIGTNLNESIKSTSERLFWYNQILISCAQDTAFYGTIGSMAEHFNEWKTIYPSETPYKTGKEQNRREELVQGMLTPENFLDIIYHFSIFMDIETADGGNIRVKTLCRYQQFRAVLRAIERLDSDKSQEERSGVIWHTQGSGKSLTMVFLVKKLRSHKVLKKYKVVMVTDRRDLDKQLGDTAVLTGEKPVLVKKISEIKEKLGNTTNNIVMTTIQKFLDKDDVEDDDEQIEEENDRENYPEINDSPNVLVIVDEAHRTHNSSLGVRLNAAFPNAVKIAFTGTPLISNKHKKKTIHTFGSSNDYIDKYKFGEAIEDGATLAILYEGKTVKGKQIDRSKFEEEFEDMFSEKSPEELARIKKKYGTEGDVLEAERYIQTISKNIVKHYVENILPNGFKAQVVASSRVAAYRYTKYINEEIQKYLSEHENDSELSKTTIDRLRIAKAILIVSSRGKEAEKRLQKQSKEQQERSNKENKLIEEIKESLSTVNQSFKKAFNIDKPETGVCFLCVKDMLLTGFDAPIEQVMYINKRMVEHNLLQAIARVNRKSKGKSRGYIVDYIGITEHLFDALKIYSDEDVKDIKKTFINKEEEIPTLEGRYRAIIQLFEKSSTNKFKELVEGAIRDADEIKIVSDSCLDHLHEPDTRGKFEIAYKKFLESLDILMPDKACAPFLRPAGRIGQLLVDAKRMYERRNPTTVMGAGEKVKNLINKFYEAEGVEVAIPPVEITDKENFKKETNSKGSKRSRAKSKVGGIRKYIDDNSGRDPARFKRLSDKLEEILKKYADNWDEQIKLLDQLIDEIDSGRKVVVLDPIKDRFLDLFNMRIEELLKGQEFNSDSYVTFVNAVVELIKSRSKEIKDFWNTHHIQSQNALESEIQDLFLELCPELFDHKEQVTKEMLKLARELAKNGDLNE